MCIVKKCGLQRKNAQGCYGSSETKICVKETLSANQFFLIFISQFFPLLGESNIT